MKQPFKIHVDESQLTDLMGRLNDTRWTDEIENSKWEYGTNLNYLQELCTYWQNGYDWQKNEGYLNTFAHFKTIINGQGIHFIHEKGKGNKSFPILLIHGYPDSFVRFLKTISLLTDPGEDGFSFDVVIPSIPGYGFSDIPLKPGMNPSAIANLFAKLMTEELGYERYFVQGGDWGSSIGEQIAANCPDQLLGIHLTDIPYYHLFAIDARELTKAEKKYLEAGKKWQATEGGYALIQGTKPQTLGYELNDSPAGLAAWIIEKFYSWSDCDGNIENCFTKDELLTNLTIYWVTQTINSAIRLYYEAMKNPASNSANKIDVPAGVAIFPKDIVPAPEEFGRRIFNIIQWTKMPKGGHFAAMEQPELLCEDIRKFAKMVAI